MALEAASIPAGAPVASRDGQIAAVLDGGTGALLTWVGGVPLSATAEDAGSIGRALGEAHLVLRRTRIADAPPFDWMDCDAPHLDAEPWVRPAVARAVHEWEGVRHHVSAWGFLHGDPAPEVFRQNGSEGTCGIIDWSSGVDGPCVYDLASACMYLGRGPGSEVVEAYAAHGPVPLREIDLALPALLRYRYAVQADYFARRVAENDLTGLSDPADNQHGLDDAHEMLDG
nr:phosphotransferase [Lapillicoccus sp.]